MDVEQIIEQALRHNPDALYESLKELRRRGVAISQLRDGLEAARMRHPDHGDLLLDGLDALAGWVAPSLRID